MSRLKELGFAFKVFFNFIRAFMIMHIVGPCVTVFGSARFTQESEYYAYAEKIGAELSKMGFTVMTGGGPGIMEAANKGAMKQVGIQLGVLLYCLLNKNQILFCTNGLTSHIFSYEKSYW